VKRNSLRRGGCVGIGGGEGGEELSFKDGEVAATLRLSVAEMRRLMTVLLRDKILIRTGADALCIRQSALAQLRARISKLGSQTLDVTRFKLLTGLSSKYAIPVLEYP
jgi:selenocysteine-specific elongation factor